jgi:hypothetical protein
MFRWLRPILLPFGLILVVAAGAALASITNYTGNVTIYYPGGTYTDQNQASNSCAAFNGSHQLVASPCPSPFISPSPTATNNATVSGSFPYTLGVNLNPTFSSVSISGISSGNCLQTTTGGLIQGTGTTCGSGGGGYTFLAGSGLSVSTGSGTVTYSCAAGCPTPYPTPTATSANSNCSVSGLVITCISPTPLVTATPFPLGIGTLNPGSAVCATSSPLAKSITTSPCPAGAASAVGFQSITGGGGAYNGANSFTGTGSISSWSLGSSLGPTGQWELVFTYNSNDFISNNAYKVEETIQVDPAPTSYVGLQVNDLPCSTVASYTKIAWNTVRSASSTNTSETDHTNLVTATAIYPSNSTVSIQVGGCTTGHALGDGNNGMQLIVQAFPI